MTAPLYDRIGRTYSASRRADPRIAAAIRRGLGGARRVVNVGAGTGAYEFPDLDVVAVEPSEVMIAQRPPAAAPVVRARAEELPFADGAFDAAMAVFSDHHWEDRERGLRELRRVARDRVVLVNVAPALADAFWLTHEYLPEFVDLIPEPYRRKGEWERRLADALGPVRIEPIPVPHDCTDGFYAAYWRRPEAYLDPAVRANISVFAQLPEAAVTRALTHLAADLDTGDWHQRHADLLDRDELDVGLRLVVADQ